MNIYVVIHTYELDGKTVEWPSLAFTDPDLAQEYIENFSDIISRFSTIGQDTSPLPDNSDGMADAFYELVREDPTWLEHGWALGAQYNPSVRLSVVPLVSSKLTRVDNELKSLLEQGKTLQAIKLYRETFSLSLVEAKRYIDYLRKEL